MTIMACIICLQGNITLNSSGLLTKLNNIRRIKMENVELIFQGIHIDDLEKLIFQELSIQPDKIKSSHFYDNLNKKDLEFNNIVSLREYYLNPGTGNILLEELKIGNMILSDVIIIISFNKQWGDVVINFSATEVENDCNCIDKNKLSEMIKKIKIVYRKISFKKILLGYEPGYDEDMLIYSIDKYGNEVKNPT